MKAILLLCLSVFIVNLIDAAKKTKNLATMNGEVTQSIDSDSGPKKDIVLHFEDGTNGDTTVTLSNMAKGEIHETGLSTHQEGQMKLKQGQVEVCAMAKIESRIGVRDGKLCITKTAEFRVSADIPKKAAKGDKVSVSCEMEAGALDVRGDPGFSVQVNTEIKDKTKRILNEFACRDQGDGDMAIDLENKQIKGKKGTMKSTNHHLHIDGGDSSMTYNVDQEKTKISSKKDSKKNTPCEDCEDH